MNALLGAIEYMTHAIPILVTLGPALMTLSLREQQGQDAQRHVSRARSAGAWMLAIGVLLMWFTMSKQARDLQQLRLEVEQGHKRTALGAREGARPLVPGRTSGRAAK